MKNASWLGFLLVLVALCWSKGEGQAVSCSQFITCNTCFHGNWQCGWCTQTGTCDNVTSTTCPSDAWQYRPSEVTNTTTSAAAPQLSTDRVNVFLRAGQPLKVDISVTPSTDYPVDLYYLMDFSASMKDDIDNLAILAQNLTAQLSKFSSDATVGFGSFIEKNLFPLSLGAYVFRNIIPLTSNFTLFHAKVNELVGQTSIIGNYDTPEAGGEALLQVLTCTSQINWRPNARKIILYSSDADFHLAGDGYIAGVTTPNSGRCELQNNVYDSNFQDYPSAGQLKKAFESTGIVPIFVVFDNTGSTDVSNLRSYANFVQYLGRGYLGSLTSDSSNVISLFREAYKVIVENISPVVISNGYEYLISSIDPPTYRNVTPGETKTFHIELLWDGSGATIQDKEVQIDFLSFGKVGILVKTDFQCVCPTTCSCPENSMCDCGRCTCNPGYSGPNCTCDISDTANRTENSVYCNGIGAYISTCRVCICPPGYTGIDCTCALSCPNGCSGQGRCECGVCYCNSPYTGLDCSCDPGRCTPIPGTPYCQGKGECNCETCECNDGWIGTYCELCDRASPLNTCQDKSTSCEALADCGSCLNDTTCRWCPSVGVCYESYLASTSCGEFWSECLVTKKQNVGAAVGGTLGAIFGFGVAGLLAWKAVIYFKDKKEWVEFEKQRAQAAWSSQANPAFRSSPTEVFNPTFGQQKY